MNKCVACMACASVLGCKTSAMNMKKSEVKSPQALGATQDSKKYKIPNKVKALLAFIASAVVISTAAILIAKGSSKDKDEEVNGQQDSKDGKKTNDKNIKTNFKNKNIKQSSNIENKISGQINEKKTENKEMSNEEINVMLDKMIDILNSFGSKDQQFLSEYDEAIKNANDEKQKEKIYSEELRSFRSKNKAKYFENIQVNSVNGSCYDREDFKWYALNNLPQFFTNRLVSFKNNKSDIERYGAKFTHNSVKYKGGNYDWQLELNDNSLRIKEWGYNHYELNYDVILTFCQ